MTGQDRNKTEILTFLNKIKASPDLRKKVVEEMAHGSIQRARELIKESQPNALEEAREQL